MPIRPTSSTTIRPTTSAPSADGNKAAGESNQSKSKEVSRFGDGFEASKGDPMVDKAVKRFAERAERIMGRDAMGMARRSAGLDSGSTELTDAQIAKLKDATIDMMKGMPVRALAPEVADKVEARLRESGYDVSGLKDKTLGELGDAGSDVAKQMVENFKADHPKSFYTLAGGLAVAGAAYAYKNGSEALTKLGVDPKVSKELGDNTKLDLRAKWGAEFNSSEVSGDLRHTFKGDGQSTSLTLGATAGHKEGENFDLTALRLGISHKRKLGDTTNLRLGSQAEFIGDKLKLSNSAGFTTKLNDDWRFKTDAKVSSTLIDGDFQVNRLNLNSSVSRSDFSLSNSLNFDRDGMKSGTVRLAVKDAAGGQTKLGADLGRDFELTKLSGSYLLDTDYRGGSLFVEGKAGYDLRNDNFDASLGAGYRRGNLDIGVVAGRNEKQGNYAGVGLKWSF